MWHILQYSSSTSSEEGELEIKGNNTDWSYFDLERFNEQFEVGSGLKIFRNNPQSIDSTSRRFVRLFMLDYERARQSRRRVVRIQSTLCEVAHEENGRGLKIAVVKVYRTVIRAYEIRSVKKYSE